MAGSLGARSLDARLIRNHKSTNNRIERDSGEAAVRGGLTGAVHPKR